MRDPSIDWLRGALILGVLVLHADMLYEPRQDTIISYANTAIGPILMPTVFAISGYLTTRTAHASTADFLRSKARRLLWPYLVWVAIYSPVLIYVEGKFTSVVDILRVVLLSPSELGPVWFLIYLFVFSVGVFVLRVVPAWLMLIVSLAASTAFAVAFGGGPAVLVHFCGFLLGLTYREWPDAWAWSRPEPRILLAVVTIMLLLVMPVFVGDMNRDNVGASALVVLGCLVLLMFRRPLFRQLGNDWLLGIGNNSLQYFLPHWPVMLLVNSVIPDSHGISGVYASVLLGIGASLLVGRLLSGRLATTRGVGLLFKYPGGTR